MPVIGFLNSGTPEGFARPLAGFRQGLREAGFIEGQNVRIEYRWAQGDYGRLPSFAAELVDQRVDVIAATGGSSPAIAARKVTSTIPIVFEMGTDPVGAGVVANLNRPGTNVTGVSLFTVPLAEKRIELLIETVPAVRTVGALSNPANPNSSPETPHMRAAAEALGRKLVVAGAGDDAEFEAAFKRLREGGAQALAVQPDPFFVSRINRIVALATTYGFPTIYGFRDYVVAGGLMSYGADFADVFRHAGIYVGRVLKGENPANLPVLQPTKFELIINLKTARTLGLTIPPTLLARADEVIE